MKLKDREILMVVSHKEFDDEAFNRTLKILENNAANITIASNRDDFAEGEQGTILLTDFELESIDPKKFDALVLIGGPGCNKLSNDPLAQEIANKIEIKLSIGTGSLILLKAGLLKGKKVRIPEEVPEKTRVEEFKDVKPSDTSFAIDGNIITSDKKGIEKATNEFVKLISRAQLNTKE